MEEEFNYQSLPEPIRKLLEEVASNLRTAANCNEENNYGLSKDWIEEALGKLPQDNGLYYYWLEAENRMREAAAEK